MGDYKIAPTWLFDLMGAKKLFKTQEKVDQAWKDGWFGPPWLVKKTPLLSTKEWETKADMIQEVEDDPRYKGLTLNIRRKVDELIDRIKDFEKDNDVETYLTGE